MVTNVFVGMLDQQDGHADIMIWLIMTYIYFYDQDITAMTTHHCLDDKETPKPPRPNMVSKVLLKNVL